MDSGHRSVARSVIVGHKHLMNLFVPVKGLKRRRVQIEAAQLEKSARPKLKKKKSRSYISHNATCLSL